MATDATHQTPAALTTQIDAFHATMRRRLDAQQFPSIQYLIKEDNRELANVQMGFQDITEGSFITESSLFRLASATKVFVSAGFLRLVQRGQLTLDTPISEVFPEYRDLKVLAPDGSVAPAKRSLLMVDLLRHSCGFGYGEADYQQGAYRRELEAAGLLGVDREQTDHWLHSYNLRDWAAALAKVPLEDEPGTRVSYGLGHDIAGAVIEEVTGQPLDLFMKQEVFEPLELNHTFFVIPKSHQSDLTSYYSYSKHSHSENSLVSVEAAAKSPFMERPTSFSGGGGWDMLGNGGMVTNSADFVTLLETFVNGGISQGRPFLSQPHAQLLCESQSRDLQSPGMLAGCEYSYGVADVIDPVSYHERGTTSDGPKGKMWWGGSTNTYFFYVPKTKRVGVFLSNTFPFGHKGAIYQFGALSK